MWLVVEVSRIALLVVEVLLLVPLVYLAVLSLAALAPRGKARATGRWRAAPETSAPETTRFAILIPAYNEAQVIEDALGSIREIDYPPERFTTIVIADNCTDDTAERARHAGAVVYERQDEEQRAKGFALRWMIERLLAEHAPYDAFVIVDADSRLSPNFLRRMDDVLAAGAEVAQGQYRVHNGNDSWTSGLRAVAFALFNHLRPLGRSFLGWSAGLKGNGMCFRRDVFSTLGWESYSLAEDAEYHARLIDAGIHVAYVPDAVVSAEMPTTLKQARSQQTRWERGRIDLMRACIGPLLRGFVRDGDLARLDAVMEIAVPPLSMLVGLIFLCAGLAVVLGWWPDIALAAVLCLALSMHIVIGAALARLSPRAYLSLLRAPLYIVWKCWIYLSALGAAVLRRGAKTWVRTERVASGNTPVN